MGATYSALPAVETTPITAAVYPGYGAWVTYWVIFGIMLGATILFSLMTFRKPMWERHHGYVTTLIVAVASTAYFSMASHAGDSLIPVYWNRAEARDVFWARYIDWFVTTPLLLLDLLMLAAVPVGTFVWVVVADIMMIVWGLFGAITVYHFRWGYFAVGCFWMFVVFWGILIQGPRYAMARNKKLGAVYTTLALYLMLVFCGYPVIWGLAEGANVINPTAEAAAYGGLDFLAKPVFGLMMLTIAGPILSRVLAEERSRGMNDISIMEAPITAPLSGVRQRIKGSGMEGGMDTAPAPAMAQTTEYVQAPPRQDGGLANVAVTTAEGVQRV